MKIFKDIKRTISVLVHSPVSVVYLLKVPTDKFVKIEPFNPFAKRVGIELQKRLQKKFPKLKVHFFGSSAFEVAGRGDVDLVIACKPRKFLQVVPEISKQFGEPIKTEDRIVVWEFVYKDIEVELALIDPEFKLYKMYCDAFRILSQDGVRERYAEFKLECDGVSTREYEWKRMKFFDEVGLRG